MITVPLVVLVMLTAVSCVSEPPLNVPIMFTVERLAAPLKVIEPVPTPRTMSEPL